MKVDKSVRACISRNWYLEEIRKSGLDRSAGRFASFDSDRRLFTRVGTVDTRPVSVDRRFREAARPAFAK